MESKLKALRVVDLKHILARAAVPVPSKSTKPDLIARVLASPAACAVYDAQFAPPKDTPPHPPRSKNDPADDLLAPPEDLDWSPDADPTQGAPPASAPSSSVKATSPPLSKPASTTASVAPSAPEASPALSAEDDELARRKARAARFGIALVEPKPGPVPKGKTPKPADKTGGAAGAKGPSALTDDPEKLAARAARFGIAPPSAADASKSSPTSGKKRAALPVDAVDAEELERRKKRAERFGMPIVGAKA